MANAKTRREMVFLPISDLSPYDKNARTHSEEQIEQICRSMDEFGFTNPVLIDEKRGVIAGHGRLEAAKILGLEDIPCIVLAGLTETQKKAYVIADNKLALNAAWDFDLLAKELSGLDAVNYDTTLTGFTVEEMTGLFDLDKKEEPKDPPDPASKLRECPECGFEF